MSRPQFSVLIAAFNAESTLGDTLDSLLAQTTSHWEAVVVDDGSADETSRIARSFAEKDVRIRVLRQDNAGAGAARNAAAQNASAPWLLPLDADDLLKPAALEQQLRFIEAHPGYDIYSWGISVLRPDGSEVLWSVSEQHGVVEEFTLAQLVSGNLLTAMTVVSAELFERVGGFGDAYLEDYDFWLRAFAAGARHLHNPELLAVYRASATSKNADDDRRLNGTAEVLEGFAARETTSAALRVRARDLAASYRALAARQRLETQLRSGDYSGARSAYRAARLAYGSTLKWGVGLAIISVSPRLFARVTRRADLSQNTNVR